MNIEGVENMQFTNNDTMQKSAEQFYLPKYHEIPDVGLYLDQVTKYINEFFAPFPDFTLTSSMISNYVKKGLVENPNHKQYSREQIAYLIYITVAKSVLSLDNLILMIRLQKASYDLKTAYDYFRLEFQNVLQYVFGLKDTLESVGVDDTEEKAMLRSTIITAAYKLHLEEFFHTVRNAEHNA